ncbi:helix-turn-helix domain-containing protein [Methylorubrum extorquens]
MSVGSRIRAAREKVGMTQSSLARQIGITPAVVSAWEKGSYSPRPESLEKVAAALCVSAASLRSGISDEVAEQPQDTEKPTVPAILARAKADIAAVLGVPPNQVKLDMNLTA